jgi:hypothetical protein
VALLLNKASKSDAFVLFVAYSFYQLFIVDLGAIYYYSCTSLLNLSVGLVLHHKNKYAAICSYSLIFVNILGFFLWYQYLPPTIYDNISLVILIIQLITITPKGLLNGFRYNIQHPNSSSNGFDSFRSCVKMLKNQTKKKISE